MRKNKTSHFIKSVLLFVFIPFVLFVATATLFPPAHVAYAVPPPPPPPPPGGVDPCAGVSCARNEECDGSSGVGVCVKICDDDCPTLCSGGTSCDGRVGWTQCLDGSFGSRVGRWVKDNPDTICDTGKRIWLETRTCGNFDPDPCYEWQEATCKDRFGCVDPPGAASCKPFNDSQCTLVDAPARIVVGNLFTGNITMKNTGVASWCPWGRGDRLYTLGSQDPELNKRWGIDMLFPPDLQKVVGPGDSQTFTFRFKAPTLAGIYPFSWKMFLQGIEWFGEKCLKTINDRPNPQIDNTCPKFDKVIGDASCFGGSTQNPDPNDIGTSTCAPTCQACQDQCQDLFGQNATYLYDSTSHRCGCEAPTDWDPEAASGQRKTCNSASGDPPFDACVLGGKSGIPCYSITDCRKTSHTECDYATQSCKNVGGAGIDQCGTPGNPDDELCQLGDALPTKDDCGGRWASDVAGNPLGNFGDPLCDFSREKLAKILQQLDLEHWRTWYFTIVSCESGYRPNAYNAVSTSGTAWGLFQMGHEAYPALGIPRQMNNQYDRGDVPWKTQAYNAVQYNKLRGDDFAYWACAS